MHNLIVWEEVLLEVFVAEDGTVWDLSHQKLNDDKQLLSLDAESSGTNLWSFSQSLDQRGLSLRILELHSLNAALIVEIASILVV